MNGFIRYWGPHNGGINNESASAYGSLLKVFLAATSLRWFSDTFLTTTNIAALLGAGAPEVEMLRKEWYCLKIMGCLQENSSFPILVWIKKTQFCKDQNQLLEDGLLKAMAASATATPVLVRAEEATQGGKRVRERRQSAIDLHCQKTHGCDFVCKDNAALTLHEKSCTKKAADQYCKMKGCKFVTRFKAAFTNHKKTCMGDEVVAAPPPKASTARAFACPHRGCNITHATKKESMAHQRKHKKKDKPTPNDAAKNATKKATVIMDDSGGGSEEPDSESTESDDGKKKTKTNKRKGGTSKKDPSTTKSAPANSICPLEVTTLFKCPFQDCGKSHATSALAHHHQLEHLKSTGSLQPAPSGMYLCPVCPKSHATAELARNHQRKHNQTHEPRQTDDQILCPECKVFRGTGAQVVAHIPACRASLTCPECAVKWDSQPELFAHILWCSTRGETVTGRKRQREDEKSWLPTRNRNNKTDVRQHWESKHVKDWLELVELKEYGPQFEHEKVDGRILLKLTSEAIRGAQFGMKPTHAEKFLELRDAFD